MLMHAHMFMVRIIVLLKKAAVLFKMLDMGLDFFLKLFFLPHLQKRN